MVASDVLIVGGGVFGLCCARACLAVGLSVTLAEPAGPGAGASGTPVGALAPHDPRAWSALKALQLAGLRALPAHVAAVEAETGLSVGHARVGRVQGLADDAARQRAEDQLAASSVWAEAGEMRILDVVPAMAKGLVCPSHAARGVLVDTLTARIEPRAYLAALVRSVRSRAHLLEGACGGLTAGAATIAGERVAAGAIVVAAGWRSFALAGLAEGDRPGEKGQAAVLAADLAPDAPVIAGGGLYVVNHGSGRVAVGSTAERDWSGTGPDRRLESVIEQARRRCPALASAPVVERWAGIRPRAPAAGPVAGPVPGRKGVWLLAGGHKIGFALAHLLAEDVAARLAGKRTMTALPADVSVERHLAAAARIAGPAG